VTRNDKLRRLASLCRTEQTAALFVVGWFCAAASEEALDDLLAAVEELREVTGPTGHLEAYRERWGRVPGEPPR
jgi:hypothetical protein